VGIGVRAFIVKESGIERVPWRRFERLLCGVPGEMMSECAGRQVRCALLYVELMNRQPVAVRHADYLVVSFGSDGRVDRRAVRRRGRLVSQSVSRAFGVVSEPVVEFAPYLATRQYRKEYKWVPSSQEANALFAAVLK